MVAHVFCKFRKVEVEAQENQKRKVSVNAMFSSENQQGVVEISSRHEEANSVTNFKNKSLPDL